MGIELRAPWVVQDLLGGSPPLSPPGRAALGPLCAFTNSYCHLYSRHAEGDPLACAILQRPSSIFFSSKEHFDVLNDKARHCGGCCTVHRAELSPCRRPGRGSCPAVSTCGRLKWCVLAPRGGFVVRAAAAWLLSGFPGVGGGKRERKHRVLCQPIHDAKDRNRECENPALLNATPGSGHLVTLCLFQAVQCSDPYIERLWTQ